MSARRALTFYDVLQVRPSASDQEVREAWRLLARRCHPDFYPGNPALAQSLFQKGYEAYAMLRTAPQREAYNRRLLTLIEHRRAALAHARARQPLKKVKTVLSNAAVILWPVAPRESSHVRS